MIVIGSILMIQTEHDLLPFHLSVNPHSPHSYGIKFCFMILDFMCPLLYVEFSTKTWASGKRLEAFNFVAAAEILALASAVCFLPKNGFPLPVLFAIFLNGRGTQI